MVRFYADKRVVLSLAIAGIVLAALAYYTYHNTRTFIETRERVFHTTQVLYHIEQTQSNAVRLEELVAKYVISADSGMLVYYSAELKQASEHYQKLRELTVDNPTQQLRIDSLRLIGREKLMTYHTIMTTRNESKPEAERLLLSEKSSMISSRIHGILSAMRDEENALLAERYANSRKNVTRFQSTFAVLMVMMFAVLVGVLIIINRNFKRRIKAELKTQEINNELEAFTYSVSHDLRAPLRSISGFTEVIKEDYGERLDAEGIRFLEKVMRNASRMGQLIDDLLDFSRIGRKEMTFSRINVALLVSEVINEMKEIYKVNRYEFKVGTLEEMVGDPGMIRQVWVNLISNAIKYSQKVDHPVIEIASKDEDGKTVYFIKDNGVGFEMKYNDKLFKVFQRLHNLTDFEGTGVGLALVHRIVSRHQGKVWATAKPGSGATFYFYVKN